MHYFLCVLHFIGKIEIDIDFESNYVNMDISSIYGVVVLQILIHLYKMHIINH